MNRIHNRDLGDLATDLIFILAGIGAGFIAFAAILGTAHIAHLLQGGK